MALQDEIAKRLGAVTPIVQAAYNTVSTPYRLQEKYLYGPSREFATTAAKSYADLFRPFGEALGTAAATPDLAKNFEENQKKYNQMIVSYTDLAVKQKDPIKKKALLQARNDIKSQADAERAQYEATIKPLQAKYLLPSAAKTAVGAVGSLVAAGAPAISNISSAAVSGGITGALNKLGGGSFTEGAAQGVGQAPFYQGIGYLGGILSKPFTSKYINPTQLNNITPGLEKIYYTLNPGAQAALERQLGVKIITNVIAKGIESGTGGALFGAIQPAETGEERWSNIKKNALISGAIGAGTQAATYGLQDVQYKAPMMWESFKAMFPTKGGAGYFVGEKGMKPGDKEVGLLLDRTVRSEIGNTQPKVFPKRMNILMDRVYRSQLKGVGARGAVEIPIESVFNDEELFSRYPELKDYKFKIYADPTNDVAGWHFAPQKTIAINAASNDPTHVFTSIVHELQHAVDDIEGFPKGGSYEDFIPPQYKWNYQMPPPEVVDRAVEQYRNISDEIIARESEARRFMTPEQRATTPPFQGVNLENVVIRPGQKTSYLNREEYFAGPPGTQKPGTYKGIEQRVAKQLPGQGELFPQPESRWIVTDTGWTRVEPGQPGYETAGQLPTGAGATEPTTAPGRQEFPPTAPYHHQDVVGNRMLQSVSGVPENPKVSWSPPDFNKKITVPEPTLPESEWTAAPGELSQNAKEALTIAKTNIGDNVALRMPSGQILTGTVTQAGAVPMVTLDEASQMIADKGKVMWSTRWQNVGQAAPLGAEAIMSPELSMAPKEPLAKPTTKAFQMLSPQTEEISFDQAVKNVTSDQHANSKAIAADIDKQTGIIPTKVYDAIGDTSQWGTENAIFEEYDGITDPDLFKYNIALKGKQMTQRAVIPIFVDPAGPDTLYLIDLPNTNMLELRQALNDAGIAYRTFVQPKVQGMTAQRVAILDQGSQYNPDTLTGLMNKYGGTGITKYRGSADFTIGGDTRAEGARAYNSIIDAWESRNSGQNPGITGQSVRNVRTPTPTETGGVTTTGPPPGASTSLSEDQSSKINRLVSIVHQNVDDIVASYEQTPGGMHYARQAQYELDKQRLFVSRIAQQLADQGYNYLADQLNQVAHYVTISKSQLLK